MATFVRRQFMPRVEHLASFHTVEEDEMLIMHEDEHGERVILHTKDLTAPLLREWAVAPEGTVDAVPDLLHEAFAWTRLSSSIIVNSSYIATCTRRIYHCFCLFLIYKNSFPIYIFGKCSNPHQGKYERELLLQIFTEVYHSNHQPMTYYRETY